MKQQPNNPVPNFFLASAADFKKIPGSPIAYWVSEGLLKSFETGTPLGHFAEVKRGMTTSDNNKFLRYWPEVSFLKSFLTAKNDEEAVESKAKWFPYSKGGGYRKWFGFLEFFINWENSGHDVIEYAKTINQSYTRTIVNIQYYFLPSVGFSYITSGPFSMRWLPDGCLYDSGGPGVFTTEEKRIFILGCINSLPAMNALKLLNPTINLQIADVVRLPLPSYDTLKQNSFLENGIPLLINLSKTDWNSYETSWDFSCLPLLHPDHHRPTLKTTYDKVCDQWRATTLEMQRLEEENNRIFIDAYGLQDELTPDVPLSEITLTCNPHYRYNGNKTEEELEVLLRTDTVKELISYAIGCMMGRYRLDVPGLIYAHSGNKDFDEIYHRRGGPVCPPGEPMSSSDGPACPPDIDRPESGRHTGLPLQRLHIYGENIDAMNNAFNMNDASSPQKTDAQRASSIQHSTFFFPSRRRRHYPRHGSCLVLRRRGQPVCGIHQSRLASGTPG